MILYKYIARGINLNPKHIERMVQIALAEDVGAGDITAALIPKQQQAIAELITREDLVVCGQAWVNEVFLQVDPALKLHWLVKECDQVEKNTVLFSVAGSAANILTAERTALNFLQLLSGTATATQHYVKQLENTKAKLLDTRKTLPLYRHAQKYAVKCGGGHNHRMGLYDAFLIKENHIAACGSVKTAIEQARENHPDKWLEIEVENLSEFDQAVSAQPDSIMLDNFSIENIKTAVNKKTKNIKLEISGNVNINNIKQLAELGVDYISVGALTKHVTAIDLSLKIIG